MNAVWDNLVSSKDGDDNAFSAGVPVLMVKRERALRELAEDNLGIGAGECRWEPVTGDASSRRYLETLLDRHPWG